MVCDEDADACSVDACADGDADGDGAPARPFPQHEVYAEVRGQKLPMRVTPMPFVPHRYFRG